MGKEAALKLAEIIEHFDSNDESLPLELLKEIAATLRALAQPQQEAIYGMNPDDWKDLTEAVKKVRDGRGIYLACRPADVFQEWFLALGTAKIKEKNT